MKLDEYQEQAETTAIFVAEKGLEYLTLGLASEAGEVAGLVKKQIRDEDTMTLTLQRRERIIGEIGDCLWYIAMLATEVNIDLSVVAQKNLDKLAKRKTSNRLKGDGSDR